MNFFKGDIVIISYPFTNLQESKPRPALVISNSTVNRTRNIILAQITSQIKNDEFSFTIDDDLVTKSLKEYCEIRCNKIFTAEKELVTKKISSIKPEKYENVFNKIASLLN